VTVHVTSLLGHVSESRFSGHRVVSVPVAWDEATRRRLRRSADDGTDVTISLDEGSYLADGAVLDDDGSRVLAVERPAERALVVRFDPSLPAAVLVEQGLALGQAFGNQHVPIDAAPGEARIPLTTSESIARETVEALGLIGAVVSVADVPLGATRPLLSGHGRHHHD
jgi:urease accessory protein